MIPEIDSRLTRSLALIGITKPTLIQQVSIPLALKGKDIVARAKTGSGKTIAVSLINSSIVFRCSKKYYLLI